MIPNETQRPSVSEAVEDLEGSEFDSYSMVRAIVYRIDEQRSNVRLPACVTGTKIHLGSFPKIPTRCGVVISNHFPSLVI